MLDKPLLRKVTFADMANPDVQGIVVALLRSALREAPADHVLVSMLSTGTLESWWILDESGRQVGLVSAQVGFVPEVGKRVFYVSTAAVAPHATEQAWGRLFAFGRQLARERGCQVLQWDTTPDNQRMLEVSRAAGATEWVRFTLEV